jgi:hypothetical protein
VCSAGASPTVIGRDCTSHKRFGGLAPDILRTANTRSAARGAGRFQMIASIGACCSGSCRAAFGHGVLRSMAICSGVITPALGGPPDQQYSQSISLGSRGLCVNNTPQNAHRFGHTMTAIPAWLAWAARGRSARRRACA